LKQPRSRGAFVFAMSLARCATVLILALVAAQKERPDRETQKQYSECLLSGGTRESCRTILGGGQQSETGEGPPPQPEDEVLERLEAERGTPSALAEQLKSCDYGEEGDTDAEKKEAFKECKDKALESLERLRGDEVKPEELERELEKAAEESARGIVKRCLDAATTDSEKEACFNSEEAKNEMAAISGRDPSEFKADDMREAMREGAASDLVAEVSNCQKNAQDEDSRKQCMKPSDEMKKQIADSMGRASGEVKDSEVREFLEEGAEEDMWSIMKSCGEDREACLESAKEMLGTATGKGKSDISDDMLERRLNNAMKNELAESMAACTRAATDEMARKRCRETLTDQLLSTADNRTKHSKGDKNQALKEAGEAAAKDVVKDCQGTREECLTRLREKAAESMGRRPEDLTEVEVERLNKEGSKEAAKESIKSCTSAKKDNAEASCDDFLAVYAAGRGKGDLDAAEQRRVKQELAEDLEKDDIALCLKSQSREEYNTCMENLEETSHVQDELFSGLEEKVKDAKKKRAKDDAAVDAVGEIFRSCMEEAETDEEKEECKKEIKERSEIAGLEEDEDDVLLKYKRNVVAESARACDASKRSECVHQAKEELVKLGLKRRAFGVVKKLADLKEAAEAFAECQEASSVDGVDDTCIEAAKATLEDLSGSTEIWSDEIQAKVQALGEALTEGREILIRKLKQVLVEAISSAATCSDAFLDGIIDRVMGVAKNFTVPGSDKDRDITDKRCRVTFGKARYFCKVSTEGMDDDETQQLSDDISEDLTTAEITVRRLGERRLGERRLSETITETYADQEVEETSTTSSSTSAGAESTTERTETEATTATTTTESTMPDGETTTTTGGTENPTGANAAAGSCFGAVVLTALTSLL